MISFDLSKKQIKWWDNFLANVLKKTQSIPNDKLKRKNYRQINYNKQKHHQEFNWCMRPATLLKIRFWNRCFPVNFAKFLRARPDDCFWRNIKCSSYSYKDWNYFEIFCMFYLVDESNDLWSVVGGSVEDLMVWV